MYIVYQIYTGYCTMTSLKWAMTIHVFVHLVNRHVEKCRWRCITYQNSGVMWQIVSWVHEENYPIVQSCMGLPGPSLSLHSLPQASLQTSSCWRVFPKCFLIISIPYQTQVTLAPQTLSGFSDSYFLLCYLSTFRTSCSVLEDSVSGILVCEGVM